MGDQFDSEGYKRLLARERRKLAISEWFLKWRILRGPWHLWVRVKERLWY